MKRRDFLIGAASLAALRSTEHAANGQARALPTATIVAQSAANTKRYVGSPSIAVLPDNTYVVSHDDFGPKGAFDTSWIYASEDRGATWQLRAKLEKQFWSTIFWHRGALYMLGPSSKFGYVRMHRSEDGGHTWTKAKGGESGNIRVDGKYHSAPTPVVVHDGRIWRACEDMIGASRWGDDFRSFMMSAPEDCDLLKRANWTFTNPLAGNPSWLRGQFGGWLEGNAVVAPDGGMVDILRVDYRNEMDPIEKAAVQTVSADGKVQSFDPARDFINFPGGCKKFTIRRHPEQGDYWSLTNHVPPIHHKAGGNIERTRNTLTLISSEDLRHWEIRAVLLYHPEVAHHGFQYADWLFEGDDIIAVVRTAFDEEESQAHNNHDANYIIFHRFPDYRSLTLKGAPVKVL